jgi:hypothetical protein
MDMLVEAPRSHRDAQMNVSALVMSFFRNLLTPLPFSKALIRDGFRCVVTGFYEKSMVENNKELMKMAEEEGGTLIATNCAHIFAESESANKDISGTNEGSSKVNLSCFNHHYAASMWAVMDRFGYKQIPSNLNGNKIHCLENVLTLDVGVHSLFDELKLWFEPTVSNPLCDVHRAWTESSRAHPIPTSSWRRGQYISPHIISLL